MHGNPSETRSVLLCPGAGYYRDSQRATVLRFLSKGCVEWDSTTGVCAVVARSARRWHIATNSPFFSCKKADDRDGHNLIVAVGEYSLKVKCVLL